eukprot:scaffold17457_cov105-Isochrysis_galbana.AAC.14
MPAAAMLTLCSPSISSSSILGAHRSAGSPTKSCKSAPAALDRARRKESSTPTSAPPPPPPSIPFARVSLKTSSPISGRAAWTASKVVCDSPTATPASPRPPSATDDCDPVSPKPAPLAKLGSSSAPASSCGGVSRASGETPFTGQPASSCIVATERMRDRSWSDAPRRRVTRVVT